MRARRALSRLAPLAALLALLACAPEGEMGEGAPGQNRAWALATPEPHATRVGAELLAGGANAVDAAIAVHMALAVTYPTAGNLGGGGFALVREPSGAVHALDFRESAPAAAHPALYLDDQGEVIPGASLHTHRAAGVPGSVAGLAALHERFASRSWPELLEAARSLAAEGFVLDAWSASDFAREAEQLAEAKTPTPEALDFAEYFRGEAGERFKQPELAATLARLAEEGAREFYEGRTAELIVEEMERGGGLITRDDLAGYEPRWRVPLEGFYRGHRVVSMPPPSSGGVALLQLLGMLERHALPPPESVARLHLFAEIEKRVFADRAEHLGDPDHVTMPLPELLDPGYLAERAAELRLDTRSDPDSIAPLSLEAPRPESEETLHFSVVDASGMAVSVTTTINASYGSGIVVDGAGFLLNNEMDDFAARPGARNLYGVTGSAANAVDAGRRPLSSMSPTLVFDRDGELRLVLGTPGGPTIFTTVFQVLVRVIDDGAGLAEAVAAPRVHHQWPPRSPLEDALYVESKEPYLLPAEVLEGLEALGYALVERSSIGNVQAIGLGGEATLAVADPRGIGLALVEGGPDPLPGASREVEGEKALAPAR